MCGIVGYIGSKRAVPVILEGLNRLEYRGYDSAGVALIEDNTMYIRKKVGRVRDLAAALAEDRFEADCGVGHTRWATHGKPSERNSHPHTDGLSLVAVVHNGIIENHDALRTELIAGGHVFVSDTDTEVIPHLIADNLHLGLEDAVRAAITRLQGAYALAIISEAEPDKLIAIRKGSPLVVGYGEGEMFLASSVDAMLPFTRKATFLEDGQWAILTRDGAEICDRDGNPIRPVVHTIEWTPGEATKEPYAHFMLKEIFEQPAVLRRIISERTVESLPFFEELTLSNSDLAAFDRVLIQACGTSWHAGLVGKYYLERMAGVHADVEISSEFRYCDPVLDPKTLVIAISQSGETADALEGIRLAKSQAVRTLGIVNVKSSSISREAHSTVYMRAGAEIGVASTKAFTAEVALLLLLSMHMGRLRWRIREDRVKEYIAELHKLPVILDKLLSDTSAIDVAAQKIKDAKSIFVIGRGLSYPIALEGALKIKEITYINATGIAAGELKHGPIALIDEQVPVIVVCPKDGVSGKTLSNTQEVRARGGFIIGIITEGDEEALKLCDLAIQIPAVEATISPLASVVPLQLLAYKVAALLGRDVDKPRNLAKAVTVE